MTYVDSLGTIFTDVLDTSGKLIKRTIQSGVDVDEPTTEEWTRQLNGEWLKVSNGGKTWEIKDYHPPNPRLPITPISEVSQRKS